MTVGFAQLSPDQEFEGAPISTYRLTAVQTSHITAVGSEFYDSHSRCPIVTSVSVAPISSALSRWMCAYRIRGASPDGLGAARRILFRSVTAESLIPVARRWMQWQGSRKNRAKRFAIESTT